MIRGWEQPLDVWRQPENVIGIVVAQKFPDLDLIREKLIEGIERVGNKTTWVVRGAAKKNDAVSVVYEVFAEYGIEPLTAPTNTAYWGTAARTWRDGELLATCERLIVFHDISSHVTEFFKDAKYTQCKVFLIERGKKKTPKRKGRKPQIV